MMTDVGVIGGGISGISIARILTQNGLSVKVFEKAHKIGGLIKCDVIKGHLFHRTGGHVFNSKNQWVNEWFWSNFDKEAEFIQARRNAKILFHNRLIKYPFENNIYQLDKSVASVIIAELLHLYKNGDQINSNVDNFESFLVSKFGKTIFDQYLKPYNSKIWKVDLSTISLDWLEGKLPMPSTHDIILSNIFSENYDEKMVHSTFFYPVIGGSQFIINRLAQGLNIQVSMENCSFVKSSNGYQIGDDQFRFIVYTGDIRKIGNVFPSLTPPDRLNPVSQSDLLRSNGTSNVLCETDQTDLSWLYIPESFTSAHRIIYTGNFSDTNSPGGSRKSCVVEFSGYMEKDRMNEELKLLPGNLTPIDYNYEPDSYVIQAKGTRPYIADFKKYLSEHNIYLCGRFAEWEYYNMDAAIESARKVSQIILGNYAN